MDNKNYDQYKRLFRISGMCVTLLLETLVFSWFWDRYYSQGLWLEPFYAKGNLIMLAVYFVVQMMLLMVYGGFQLGYYRKTSLGLSQCISLVFGNVIIYIQITLLYRHLPEILPMIAMTAINIVVAIVMLFFLEFIYAHIFPKRKLIIVYGKYPAEEIIKKITTRKDKYVVVETINIAEGYDNICEVLKKYPDGAVVLHNIKAGIRSKIIKFCYQRNMRFYVSPKVSDILISNSEVLHIFDTPLLLCRTGGLTIDQRFLKRALDILVSLVLVILTSPFMFLTAIAIKVQDGGPVFYKQTRYTINKKKFGVLKFRSMVTNAEGDGVARLAKEHDDRITPIGKFIRATRLDELPQLFNILTGDMSLVGPRPERPEIADRYEKEMPEFAFRLKVKAGLTGYAQIYGKYNTTSYDKLKLDLMYIESYSFLMDIKLILSTVKIMFMKESTEGVSDEKTRD